MPPKLKYLHSENSFALCKHSQIVLNRFRYQDEAALSERFTAFVGFPPFLVPKFA
jgi:hypothetical protein